MSALRSAFVSVLLTAISTGSYAQELAPVVLSSLSAVPQDISSANIMDQNGDVIGQVLRVQADQDGKPSALAFRATRDGRTVVVSATAVSYDGHVLVTDSNQPQIAALLAKPQRTAAK
jgi:type IV secretory pathway TraG/TraD family ATPase VirD4